MNMQLSIGKKSIALLLFSTFQGFAQTDYEWQRFSGVTNSQGATDSSIYTPRFNYPNDVVMLADGSLIISDSGNQSIRKCTPSGIVTTFAGLSGIHGSADGTGTNARFNGPGALELDSTGNIFVADTGNIVIRKITPSGVVTTHAGISGQYGTDNGAATSATFSYIADLVVDSAGNMFVADTDNHCIRKISNTGIVSTFAGSNDPEFFGTTDNTGTAARFNSPTSIALAPDGNLFILDTGNGTIRKATPSGVVTTLPIGNVAGSYARIETTAGGDLICTDLNNHRIIKIINENTVQVLAGGNTAGSNDGTGTAARFHYPIGIHFASDGNFYITDTHNHLIRKCSTAGVVTRVSGVANTPGLFDTNSTGARFSAPSAIHVDEQQQIIVCDTANHTLRMLNANGATATYSGLADDPGNADGTLAFARFDTPSGICKFNNYYLIADTLNHIIRKIDATGNVTTLAGQAGSSGTTDGTGAVARFNRPHGMTVDISGNAYVADRTSNTIRKITPTGEVSTIAGSANLQGSDDGFGSSARFNRPTGIVIDSSGSLFVSDQNNHTIRKITSAGQVTTIAGEAGIIGNADGSATSSRFSSPAGLALDAQGGLIIADQGNNLIRRLFSDTVSTLTDSNSYLNAPKGVFVAPDKRIFVTSSAANTIIVGTMASSDQDADGLPDWQELVQGLPTNASNTGYGKPTAIAYQGWPSATDSKYPHFTFRCWPGIDHGYSYRVQESIDLINWSDTNMQTNRVGLPQPSGDAIPVEKITVRANSPMSAQPRHFMRLMLESPWPPPAIKHATVDLSTLKSHADANIAALIPANTHTKQAYDNFSSSSLSTWSRFGWTSKVDLSKISWETSQDCTLISPQHVLMSSHWKRSKYASVIFHDRYGNRHVRSLIDVREVGNRLFSDLAIGKLDSPVAIGHYKVLPPRNDWNSYLQNAHVLSTNHFHEILVRKINYISNGVSQSNANVDYAFSGDYNNFYQPPVIGGDSGNPSFIIINGEPILISLFWYGGSGAGPFISNSILFEQINNAMIASGGSYQLQTINLNP